MVQELPLAIEQRDLAARAETRVDGDHGLLTERGGEEQFAEIVGEDADRGLVGALLGVEPHFRLHCRTEQPLGGVGDGEADLLGAGCGSGALGGGGLGGGAGADEQRLDLGEGGGVVGQRDPHHQEQLLLAPAHGQHAMARRLGERLGPLEVVFVLGGLGGRLLAEQDL